MIGATWPLKLSEANNMAASQGYVCAICGVRPPSGKRLVVDHCHRTMKVRGMLCVECNWGLGHFKDSSRSLLAAVGYLERFRLAADVGPDERAFPGDRF